MRIFTMAVATVLMAAVGLAGCSSQQQEEENLETSQEAGDDQGESQEQWSEQDDMQEEGGDIGSGLADLDTEEVAEPAQPAAFTGSTAPDAQRVVRYISTDDTPVFSQASDEGESVGTLQKGDRVMVIEDGDWAKLSDQMFIKVENLSDRATGRTRRDAQWKSNP